MPKDPYRYFRVEAQELLGRITAGLEGLRHSQPTEESMRQLKRWTHTLKGAAHVVRRDDIAKITHRLETQLEGISQGNVDIDPALTLSREIADLLSSLDASRATHSADISANTENNSQPLLPASQGVAIQTLRVELSELDSLLQAVNETAVLASGLQQFAAPLSRMRELATSLHSQSFSISNETLLVKTQSIAADLEETVTAVRRNIELAGEGIERRLTGLRTMVEDLRLVRASSLAAPLESTIRAAAEAAGKQVEFDSSGGEMELDAHVVLAVRDALIQVARNAVIHGIEAPEVRLATGKPAGGKVLLEFWRDATQNVFRIKDDGHGIDLEVLRGHAVRRGWLTSRQAREASSQQLTALLLRPGVTTAAAPDEFAGRGIGLDILNSTAAHLKGELHISAERGQGTTVELRVPSSITSAVVMKVLSGERTLGLQMRAIRQATLKAELPRLLDRYRIEDRTYSVVSLASLFETPANRRSETISAVVLEIVSPDTPFLLAVDKVLAIEQSVIHALPEHMQPEPFVVGAAMDRRGEPYLILDPALMRSTAIEQEHEHTMGSFEPAAPLPILVVDDSITTRMLEQSILETAGYAVDLAASAEEAMLMARHRHYGLFLVDVEMPGMDGFTFVQESRQETGLQQVPAILVSSRNSKEDRQRGTDAGASDYIVKGEFDQRYLLRRVHELMAGTK